MELFPDSQISDITVKEYSVCFFVGIAHACAYVDAHVVRFSEWISLFCLLTYLACAYVYVAREKQDLRGHFFLTSNDPVH